MNDVVTQNICAEGFSLRWNRGAINAMEKHSLLMFVGRRKKHIVAKPKVTEQDRLSMTSKVTEPNHRLKVVDRMRSSVWLTVHRRKTLGSFL